MQIFHIFPHFAMEGGDSHPWIHTECIVVPKWIFLNYTARIRKTAVTINSYIITVGWGGGEEFWKA